MASSACESLCFARYFCLATGAVPSFSAYLKTLPKANDEVYHFLLLAEHNCQFRRVFICPQHYFVPFAMSLPAVALDSTSLKTKLRQNLLVAVGRDVSNTSFLRTWAEVEGGLADLSGVVSRSSHSSDTGSQYDRDYHQRLRQGSGDC
jgi:hypothetical protein